MADRIGVINKGRIILVEEKTKLMKKLGKKQLILTLKKPLEETAFEFGAHQVDVSPDRTELVYTFDSQARDSGISSLLAHLGEKRVELKDLQTKESSLEEIFVQLVGRRS